MRSFCPFARQAVLALCFIFLSTSAAADVDVGSIAVIEADPTILQPGELFDLNNQTLTFTPRTGGGYTVSVGALNSDTNLETNITSLFVDQFGNPDADDGFVSQTLSFNFPFFGVNRNSVFINSNGNLTFGSGSTLEHFNVGGDVNSLGTDLADVLDLIATGLPRIAVLWQDWNPAAATAGGGVFASSRPDRLVVTWQNVPLFGPSTTATFQVVLFNSGVIQMNYQSVTSTPGGGYLVGISPGSRRSDSTTTTLNLSQGGSSISSFPNFEPLVQVFGSSTSPLVHINAVARRFFNTHGDSFDQLVMFANFTHAMGGAFAFEQTTRQTVSGIHFSPFNNSSFFGSAGRLQSFVNLNRLGVYSNDLTCLQDPQCRIPGNNDSVLTLLGQESGHMWLAAVRFNNSGTCSNLLLGRDLVHWSFFKDSDASNMEGNNWVENPIGTFTTNELTIRFSRLDQYIMGLRPAAEVPQFFFISNPGATTPSGRTSTSAPEVGVTVSGTRQNVMVDDIQFCEGQRSPGFTGVNTTTTWKQAFILLIPSGATATSTETTKIDTIRSAWQSYFTTATESQGSVDTTIPLTTPVISVTPSSHDFGSVDVGSFADRTFTVQNTGGGTLSGNASTSAPFSIASGGSYSLAGGASQAVTARFSPTSAVFSTGNVTFTGGGGASRTVTGTGVTPTTFTLTVAKGGSGDGTITATGINCGTDCTETYNSGTSVTLTATAAAGSTFARWAGDADCSDGAVTMSANRTCTAVFSLTFTDDPLTTQVTLVKAVHITQLRQAVDTLRSRNSLAAFTYTDSTLTVGATQVKAAHITDLRTALNDVYNALARTPPTYTDPTITPGQTVIKAAHITEIRSAIRAVVNRTRFLWTLI